MTLSKPCREALADLVHNKLSCLHIVDRDDRREAAILQKCLAELTDDEPHRLARRPLRTGAETHAA